MNYSKRIICLLLTVVLLAGAMIIPTSAAGQQKMDIGFVAGSNLRLRSEPSLTADVLASANTGEVVVVLEQQGDWYKVIYNLQEGYMHKDFLSVATKENAELGYGVINGTSVNLRSGPSTSYGSVGQANTGDKAYIIGINEGWYKVIFNAEICYVRSDFLDLTEVPYENEASSKSPVFFRGGKSTGVIVSASAIGSSPATEAPAETPSEAPAETPTETPSASVPSTSGGSATGVKIVSTAEQYLGVPYVWGGSTPNGFDCSGFVYYVLKSLGYSPYRTSSSQYQMGTAVDKSQLQPGDLVFFQGTYKNGISHVGIYVGGGQFIHSPSTGGVVCYDSLNSAYYTTHYYGARRMG